MRMRRGNRIGAHVSHEIILFRRHRPSFLPKRGSTQDWLRRLDDDDDDDDDDDVD